jgi:hypothetical protein
MTLPQEPNQRWSLDFASSRRHTLGDRKYNAQGVLARSKRAPVDRRLTNTPERVLGATTRNSTDRQLVSGHHTFAALAGGWLHPGWRRPIARLGRRLRWTEAGTGSRDAFGAFVTGKSDGAPGPCSCPAVVAVVALPGPGNFTREGGASLPGSGAGSERGRPPSRNRGRARNSSVKAPSSG